MSDTPLKVDLTWWCHHLFGPKWNIGQFIKAAKAIGAAGIELAPVEHWPALGEAGLSCPVALLDYGPDEPPFKIGWNDPADRSAVFDATAKQIENCSKSSGVCSKVIAFSGMRKKGIGTSAAIGNCVAGLKTIAPQAEAAGVTVLFECLNDQPQGAKEWKGHPGYDATSLKFGLDVVKGVGSQNVKLVVDLYHTQRQEGNLIQNLEQVRDWTDHIHTAGLGEKIRQELNVGYQDLNHRDVFRYLRSWYKGGVGIEYIPTQGRKYKADLKAAIRMING